MLPGWPEDPNGTIQWHCSQLDKSNTYRATEVDIILNGLAGPKNPACGVSPSPLKPIEGGLNESDISGKVSDSV